VTDSMGTDRPRSAAQRRSELGYRSRLERRTARRAERRRKAAAKIWYLAVPAAAVLAAVIVLAVVFGGRGGADLAAGPAASVTTPAGDPGSRDGLLVIQQQENVPAVVLLHPQSRGGVVIAFPGITLLKTSAGFKTMADIHASGESGLLEEALSEALGVPVGEPATAEWADLRAGVASLAAPGTTSELPPAVLGVAPGEADLVAQAQVVAQAVLLLCGAIDSEDGAAFWGELELGGDGVGLVDLVAAEASSTSTGTWTAMAAAGQVREGKGFAYVEPDVRMVKAALEGPTETDAVTLELQNGSGAIGVTEGAGALLEALGFSLLPYSNAEDFPDVVQTRITFAPDAAAAAERVRDVLAVGEMSEDETLQSGRVVVVLGKDFVPPSDATGSGE